MNALERFDVDRFRPDRITLLWAALLVNVEVFLTVVYLQFADVTVTQPRYFVYPFIWINVGVLAAMTTTVAPTSPRKRRLAAAAAVGYFTVLAYFGGLVSPGHAFHGHSHASGFGVIATSIPPGWGPAVLYNGALVSIQLLPFKVIGYVTLTYLVYATIVDATGAAAGGLLGLLSCVSCSWPILASIVSGIAGSSTGIASAVYSQSYGLSTVVFVITVALLYWRPFRR